MALLDFTHAPHGGRQRLLHPENENEPRITPRAIILHTIVGDAEATAAYFDDDNVPLESTFLVAGRWFQTTWPDGYIVQLIDTARQADANYKANPFAISIETEDDGSPADTPWTPAQLDSLAWLLRQCARIHRIPLRRVDRWDGSGVGYHAQFPGVWTPVAGKTCPGAARIAQIPVLLARAQQGQGDDMPLTDADKAIIKEALQEWFGGRPVGVGTTGPAGTITAILDAARILVNEGRAQTTALATQVTDLKSGVLGAITALPTAGMDDADLQTLASKISIELAATGLEIDPDPILDALRARLAA